MRTFLLDINDSTSFTDCLEYATMLKSNALFYKELNDFPLHQGESIILEGATWLIRAIVFCNGPRAGLQRTVVIEKLENLGEINV